MLAPGVRVGPYEIVETLRPGGMGEVYRARDTTLKRDVAIKVLPERFTSDPDRLARLQREAEVLAALNHAHIAHIHGLEESGGVRALVLEFVEGEDLAERIASGPIPLDEALAIAEQIANALEAAHEIGIVHRDLKPANVKVRPDGTVKVLDFGLAKVLERGSAIGSLGREQGTDVAAQSTITSPAVTGRGVILGTAAYMAPEQATGKPVDKRVDVWAFGCVLYELLTARRAFPGNDISDTLASVVTKDVDWAALPAHTPSAIRTLLRRCLQKNPKERLRDIGDAWLAVRDAATAPDSADSVGHRSPFGMTLPWIVAVTALVAAATLGWVAWHRPIPPAGAETRFLIAPPSPGESLSDPLVSPDGSFVVFRGSQLYIRRLAEIAAHPLPGTQRAEMPFLSPDGRWVGFFAEGKLKKVAIAGGDPLVICDAASNSPGAVWAPGNRILFTPAWANAALVSVSADGGPITPVSTLDTSRGERGHWWPEPLPDGRRVLFTIFYADAGLSKSRIAVLDLESGQHRPLLPGALARYAGGNLLFFRAGVFQAVPFDPQTLVASGEPRVVLPKARAMYPLGESEKTVGISESGSIAYQVGELYPERIVTWVYRDGRSEPTTLTIPNAGVSLSPDGTKLAYARPEHGTSQIAIYDFASKTEQRLQSPGFNYQPIWHPDGRRIGFISMRKGDLDVYVEPIDGSPAEELITTAGDEALTGWLPNGQPFVAAALDSTGVSSLFVVDMESKARVPLITGNFPHGWTVASPDGRWLAICAIANAQLYVRPLSGAGGPQSVRTCRSQNPAVFWSRSTRELVFTRGTELVVAQYIDRDGRFIVQREQIVARVGVDEYFYGISPDGQRFLIGTRANLSPAEPGIEVVVNGLGGLIEAAAR